MKYLSTVFLIVLISFPSLAQKRPQDPIRPYPYNDEDVYFNSNSAGIRLAGTLTYPKLGGPFPAVVLISGSGANDRDESIFNHRPFLVLADYLTRHGIAVLRFDDRGAGKSNGDYMAATIEDFAYDVVGAVDYLKTRNEIDTKKIGLIGHSEGGLIAPMVAAQLSDIAFIVLMAAPGIPVAENLLISERLLRKASGQSEESIQKWNRMRAHIFDIIKQEQDNRIAEQRIRKLLDEVNPELSPNVRKKIGDRLMVYLTDKLRFLLFYDPRPTLMRVKCPVLSINGEKDLQAPPKENLEAIKKALQAGGNHQHTIRELPGLNHIFQTARVGTIQEYKQIEETFAVSALELISDWILAQTAKTLVRERKLH